MTRELKRSLDGQMRKKFERTMKALFRVPKDEVKEEIKRKINKPRKAKG